MLSIQRIPETDVVKTTGGIIVPRDSLSVSIIGTDSKSPESFSGPASVPSILQEFAELRTRRLQARS